MEEGEGIVRLSEYYRELLFTFTSQAADEKALIDSDSYNYFCAFQLKGAISLTEFIYKNGICTIKKLSVENKKLLEDAWIKNLQKELFDSIFHNREGLLPEEFPNLKSIMTKDFFDPFSLESNRCVTGYELMKALGLTEGNLIDRVLKPLRKEILMEIRELLKKEVKDPNSNNKENEKRISLLIEELAPRSPEKSLENICLETWKQYFMYLVIYLYSTDDDGRKAEISEKITAQLNILDEAVQLYLFDENKDKKEEKLIELINCVNSVFNVDFEIEKEIKDQKTSFGAIHGDYQNILEHSHGIKISLLDSLIQRLFPEFPSKTIQQSEVGEWINSNSDFLSLCKKQGNSSGLIGVETFSHWNTKRLEEVIVINALIDSSDNLLRFAKGETGVLSEDPFLRSLSEDTLDGYIAESLGRVGSCKKPPFIKPIQAFIREKVGLAPLEEKGTQSKVLGYVKGLLGG